jgi:hypothetical protein
MLKIIVDARKCLAERPERRPKHSWEGSIRIYLRKIACEGVGF